MIKNETQSWISTVKPKTGWFDFNLNEIIQYKDLIVLLVKRDFVVQFKQTILGPIWFFLQPLFTTIVFTIIFGKVAKVPTDGVPPFIFYMAGNILWLYFSESLTKTADTFITNSNIFGKVYFPRLTVPITIVISNIFIFLIQYVLFLGFLTYYYMSGTAINPNWTILLTPVILIYMAALSMGLGIIISSLTTKYRDLKFLLKFGIQLWMYATPIVYPLSIIPEKWRLLASLNPMAPCVEFFRYAYLGEGYINIFSIGLGVLSTFLILGFGIILFSRIEKTFMDTV